MSATATAPGAPVAAKSGKGKLKIIIAAVAVLLLAGAGGGWYVLTQRHKADADHEAAPAAPKTPPTFLPLEAMVANLADPGGDRMVQIGITIQMADAKSAEEVKVYMPSIRSNILLLVSQHTSQELLRREGKEELAAAIAREIAAPLGFKPEAEPDDAKPQKGDAKHKKAPKAENPVQNVLFSSFIIQ